MQRLPRLAQVTGNRPDHRPRGNEGGRSVMKSTIRIAPPHLGHSRGNTS